MKQYVDVEIPADGRAAHKTEGAREDEASEGTGTGVEVQHNPSGNKE